MYVNNDNLAFSCAPGSDFLPEPSKGWQREKVGKLREKN